MAKNPLRTDPSRTTTLRRRYMADMRRRFAAISRAIQELIVNNDALGLITSEPLTFLQRMKSVPVTTMQQVPRQAWRFNTDANKVKAYRKWLQQQIDAKILTVNAISGKPWTATYAESAYRKGMTRAYTQIHSMELAKSVDFYEGSKAQFIKDAFSQPAVLSKIELMYTRAFDELKGVTDAMSQQMSRILANGMIKGDGPRTIARELRKNVAGMEKRAMTIAKTEVIMVHAEGQLDAFEMLGVEEVGIMAEFSTAGDDRVCEQCGGLEGVVMTIDEARGIITVHPNCRCAWVPYVKGVHKRKTKRAIRKKLKTAIPRWPSTKRKVKVEKAVTKISKEVETQTVYHGTSVESANKIIKEGFKPGTTVGMSSVPVPEFIFVTPKKAGAQWYAKSNFRFRGKYKVVESKLDGKLFKVEGFVSDFEAMGKFAKEVGIMRETESLLNLPAIAKKLKELGYSGIEYKDSISRRLSYAVLPKNLEVIK